MLAESKLAVKTDIIKVESGTGKDKKYEIRKWNGGYTPIVASATSPRPGVIYEHLRFENNVPVVREINISELLASKGLT